MLICNNVFPVSVSASRENAVLTCFGKCSDLPNGCEAFCKAKKDLGGVCLPPFKVCCCF